MIICEVYYIRNNDPEVIKRLYCGDSKQEIKILVESRQKNTSVVYIKEIIDSDSISDFNEQIGIAVSDVCIKALKKENDRLISKINKLQSLIRTEEEFF